MYDLNIPGEGLDEGIRELSAEDIDAVSGAVLDKIFKAFRALKAIGEIVVPAYNSAMEQGREAGLNMNGANDLGLQ